MSAETTIDACRFRVSNEPPRAVGGKSDGHTVDPQWSAHVASLLTRRRRLQRARSAEVRPRRSRGDDYVKSGNRRCAELLAHRDRAGDTSRSAPFSRFCRASAFAAHTLLIGMCGPSVCPEFVV